MDASVEPASDGVVVVDVKVHAPAHTPTQTPVTNEVEPTYADGATFAGARAVPGHEAAPVRGPAGRVARRRSSRCPRARRGWPWRASLARAELGATWNRANVVLPALSGDVKVRDTPESFQESGMAVPDKIEVKSVLEDFHDRSGLSSIRRGTSGTSFVGAENWFSQLGREPFLFLTTSHGAPLSNLMAIRTFM